MHVAMNSKIMNFLKLISRKDHQPKPAIDICAHRQITNSRKIYELHTVYHTFTTEDRNFAALA